MKTAISIPDPVFDSAERLAHRLGVSRSELYTKAIRQFVQHHDASEVTARLNELYETESSELDPVLQSMQSRSVDSGSWK